MRINIESICLTDQIDCLGYEPGMDLEIEETSDLDNELDKIRVGQGWKPLFDDSVIYDSEGWYNFLVKIDTNNKIVPYITGWCENIEEDDDAYYQIPVDNGKELYERIAELLREKDVEVI